LYDIQNEILKADDEIVSRVQSSLGTAAAHLNGPVI